MKNRALAHREHPILHLHADKTITRTGRREHRAELTASIDHAVSSADTVVTIHEENADFTAHVCIIGTKKGEIVQSGISILKGYDIPSRRFAL